MYAGQQQPALTFELLVQITSDQYCIPFYDRYMYLMLQIREKLEQKTVCYVYYEELRAGRREKRGRGREGEREREREREKLHAIPKHPD